MSKFSDTSLNNLSTCHPDLIRLFTEVIKHWDCRVTYGHRDEETQNRLFNMTPKVTRLEWPNSAHNKMPSMAADVIPYPVDWEDRPRFWLFRGRVYGVAEMMGIKLKKTIKWDLPHFELTE